MSYDLDEIKRKYFINSDCPIAVGDAAEIRWLINLLEQYQEQEKLKSEGVKK